MNIPYWLLRLLPMWDYVCPKCKRDVPKKSNTCPHCGENYGLPLRVPPKVLKDPKALEAYVHKHIFPRVSEFERNYLTKYFTTLFSDGFESGDFSAWTETSGTPTIVTSPVHHGTYGALLDSDDEIVHKTIDVSEAYFRFYFRYSAMPASGETYDIGGLWQHTYLQFNTVMIINDGGTVKWRLKVCDSGWVDQYDNAASGPAINTWYCVELWWKGNTANGAKLWVDGNLLITTSANPTFNANMTTAALCYLTSGASAPNQWYDCVVVADAYIGPEVESYIQLAPDSTGKKQRYRQRIVGVDTVYEQALRMAQRETYFVVNTAAQTHVQNLHFISLFNASGSGKKVVVKDVKWNNGQLAAIIGPTAIEIDVKLITAQGSGGTTLTPRKFDSANPSVPAQVTALQAPTTPPTESSVAFPLFINQEEVPVGSEWAFNMFSIFGKGVRKSHCQQIVLNEGEGITIKEVSAPGSPAGASSFQIIFNLE